MVYTIIPGTAKEYEYLLNEREKLEKEKKTTQARIDALTRGINKFERERGQAKPLKIDQEGQ